MIQYMMFIALYVLVLGSPFFLSDLLSLLRCVNDAFFSSFFF